MQTDSKVVLFEQTPIPKVVAQLAVPTVLSSLVMVIYNLADTFFVGMLNDPDSCIFKAGCSFHIK